MQSRKPAVFLSEKFTPARLPEICAPRKDLLGVFDAAAQDGFVYVGAQGGSGKTVSTLLWLGQSDRIPVWIGLDSYDNSLSVFYKLLATGLYSLQPENANMRSILTSSAFSATPVEHTIELLSEMLPDDRRYAIVLDDFHTITSGEVIKSLPAVLKRLPLSFVVFILSRNDIPGEFLPLIKQEKQDIIRPTHLRFTEAEIKQYFNNLGRFLTPDEVKFAYMATDGWAIGVNAVAISGQIEQGGGYVFASYFEGQVWSQWDQSLRDFCMCTCIVGEFDTELAQALSKREDARLIMEDLSKSNSFLSLLHDDTYRYHHLFQDFLREQLEKSNIDIGNLHKTAAQYYKAHSDYSKALRYWLDSGDYKGIDTYMYLFLFENNKGILPEYADFLRTFFVRDFPQKAFKVFPALHVLSAWYNYLTSHREEFEYHMDAIYKNLPRIAMGDSRFVEYAILAYSVDHRTSILTKIKKFGSFSKFVKKFTPYGLATTIASISHNLPYMHRSNLDYSDLALDEDSMEKLENTFSVLLGVDWNYIKPCIPACMAYERNRIDEALEHVLYTRTRISEDCKPEGVICVMIQHHTILWQMKRDKDAAQALDALTAFVESKAQFFVPNLLAYKAKLKLLDGNKQAAREWLDHYFVVETGHIELFRLFQHFTTARAYMVMGDTANAHKYILMLKQYGTELNRPLDAGEAGALLACLEWAIGRKKEAVQSLMAALETLQPYGFINVIANEGASITPVLKRIVKLLEDESYAGTLTREYVNEVLLAAHDFSKRYRGVTANLGKTEKLIKLSKQQAQMLALLSRGYKNAEISRLTGLKIPTIKTHTSIAYKKLGVNNAMDAILKARELGLIER